MDVSRLGDMKGDGRINALIPCLPFSRLAGEGDDDIFFNILGLSFSVHQTLRSFRTSPLPAPGRGVPSLRGGVREQDRVQNTLMSSGSTWFRLQRSLARYRERSKINLENANETASLPKGERSRTFLIQRIVEAILDSRSTVRQQDPRSRRNRLPHSKDRETTPVRTGFDRLQAPP